MAYRTPEGEPYVYVVEASDSRRLYYPSFVDRRVILHNTEADQDTLDLFLGAGTYHVEDTMHAHAVYAGGIGSEAKERKERGSPHNLDFLGSLRARTNRWKHLATSNPIQYAAGDALGTWDVWHDEILPNFNRDPAAEWVYRHRQLPLLPIIRRRRKSGIRVDGSRVAAAVDALGLRISEAEEIARANVGRPSFNIGSPDQVARQLYDVEQFGRRK
jgi:DNA polymerase I-like protein with 3'-5' exonuclease and polymerase domains